MGGAHKVARHFDERHAVVAVCRPKAAGRQGQAQSRRRRSVRKGRVCTRGAWKLNLI